MPKKRFNSGLQALFAGFEHRETSPDVENQQESVSVSTSPAIAESEVRTPEIKDVNPPKEVSPVVAPETSKPKEVPSQPILYEPEEVGFVFTGSTLEPLQGTALKSVDLENAISAPLVETGQPVGAMVIEPDPNHPWSIEEQNLAEAVAQQVSLQIQTLRLLDSAERAKAEAQAATRQFAHKSWDSYMDGIHQSERIGYAYDQKSVEPFSEPVPEDGDYQETVSVLDEQVGRMILKTDPNQRLSEEDRRLVSAVAQQVGQQVENLRLLADAARARTEAEEATRRLTQASWEEYAGRSQDAEFRFMYDQNRVVPLAEAPADVSVTRPLVVRGETVGELAVAGLEHVPPESAQLLTEIATQASLHLETIRLSEELRRRAAELQELDRLKTSFLANMSHELRTPLNSILGFSDVMLEGIDGPLSEFMENDLKLIQKNGLHLLHLINDVLDMAKIESGRMNLHPEPLKLYDTFTEVINITSALAGAKNLEVFIEPDSNPEIEILADVTRLRQVMINLVNNSIKFTDQGHISIRADELPDDQVMISVKDTGIGIPPEHLESIFQEFSQVDTSTTRKVGGTGLGLPISRRLIELHGGKMWAESKNVPGEGSVFKVVLPRQAVISEHVEIIAKK